MKKQILYFLTVILIFMCSCSKDTGLQIDNTGTKSSIDKIIIQSDYFPVENEKELIEDSKLIIIGKIVDISFEVSNSKVLKSPEDIPSYDFKTIYTIEVIESYKGECAKTIKLTQQGGIEGYKEEEQLELIIKEKNLLFSEELLKDNKINWKAIPIRPERKNIKEGNTYVFFMSRYSPEYNYVLISPQESIYEYTQSNPFKEEQQMSFTLKNVLSELNVWDDFWVQWQKDNPEWETWLDKAEVEAALLKIEEPSQSDIESERERFSKLIEFVISSTQIDKIQLTLGTIKTEYYESSKSDVVFLGVEFLEKLIITPVRFEPTYGSTGYSLSFYIKGEEYVIGGGFTDGNIYIDTDNKYKVMFRIDNYQDLKEVIDKDLPNSMGLYLEG